MILLNNFEKKSSPRGGVYRQGGIENRLSSYIIYLYEL
jgi:hypothetical protein